MSTRIMPIPSEYQRSGNRWRPSLALQLGPNEFGHLPESSHLFEIIAEQCTSVEDRRLALLLLFQLNIVKQVSTPCAFNHHFELRNSPSYPTSYVQQWLKTYKPVQWEILVKIFSMIDKRKKRSRSSNLIACRKYQNKKKPIAKQILVIGMRRPSHLRPKQQLEEAVQKIHFDVRQDIRDEARILAIETLNPGLRVFSLTRERPNDSDGEPPSPHYHLECDMQRCRKFTFDSMPIFEQVFVDYIWMPSFYLKPILSKDFFEFFLPRFHEQDPLTGGRSIFIPLDGTVICQIIKFWKEFGLDSKFLFRLLRVDQEDENLLLRCTNREVDLGLFGKPSDPMPAGVKLSQVKEALRLHGEPADLSSFLPFAFPHESSVCRFLCITQRLQSAPLGLVVAETGAASDQPCSYCHLPSLPHRLCCRVLGIGQPVRQHCNKNKQLIYDHDSELDELLGRGSDDDYDDDDSTDSFEDAFEDAFDSKDERKIAKEKSVEKASTSPSKDIRLINVAFERQLKLDDKPNGPDNWWGTAVMQGADSSHTPHILARKFRLDKPSLFKAFFSKTGYWAEKAPIQNAFWTSFHRRLHSVCGSVARDRITAEYAVKFKCFRNNTDHHFNPRDPMQPCIVNTKAVVGVSDSFIAKSIGLPTHLVGAPLLVQQDWAMEVFLVNCGDELIRHCVVGDKLQVFAQHNGACIRAGQLWRREGGVGVAVPGMFPVMKLLSARYRECLYRFNVLAHHHLIEIMFGENRAYDRMGRPEKERRRMMQEWLEFLLPPTVAKLCQSGNSQALLIRVCDAISVLLGAAYLHFDWNNGQRQLHTDQVTLLTKYIPTWRRYLNKTSLAKMRLHGVAEDNSGATIVHYGRSIYDFQLEKVDSIVNLSCPFVQALWMMNKIDYPQDCSRLDDAAHFDRFRRRLNLRMVAGSDYPYLHHQEYESSSRDGMMYAFVNVWLRVVTAYSPVTQFRHTVAFLAFVVIECNGVSLLCGVLEEVLSKGYSQEIASFFRNPRNGSIFVWLSGLFISKRGNSGVISCTHPRYQKKERMVFDSERKSDEMCWSDCDTVVSFFLKQQDLLNSPTKEEVSLGFKCYMNADERKKIYGNDITRNVKMSSVRCSMAVQLASKLLLVPAKYSNWATITKGSSGFYKTVEHLRGQSTGMSLSTPQAIAICSETIKILRSKGCYAHWGWMDQNSCLYWRWKMADYDTRRVEYILAGWDGTMYTPIRTHEAKEVRVEYFAEGRQWLELSKVFQEYQRGNWYAPISVKGLTNGLTNGLNVLDEVEPLPMFYAKVEL